MNLDDMMVDPAKLAGVWWDFETRMPCPGNQPHEKHICMKVVPHGSGFESTLQQLLEPFLLERRRGQRIPVDDMRKVRGRALAKEVLRDWRNLEVGSPAVRLEYSEEKAFELLTDPKWELVRRFVESAFSNESALLFEAEREAGPN